MVQASRRSIGSQNKRIGIWLLSLCCCLSIAALEQDIATAPDELDLTPAVQIPLQAPEALSPISLPDLGIDGTETDEYAATSAPPAEAAAISGLTPAAPPANIVATTQARERMYEALFNVQDKKYEEAIPKLEWVIREDPTLMEAWEALGWSYYYTEQKEKARELWERLVTLAPNQTLGYNALAQLATADPGIDSLNRAATLFKKSLEINPNQYEIRFYYAQNLLWRGFLDEAVERLGQLLQEDPDRLDVRLELARAMFQNQLYEQSLEHWAIIRKVAPDNVEYLVAESRALLYVGDLEIAKERALQALALDESNIQALTILADIAEYSKKNAAMLDDLRKVADLAKDNTVKGAILQRMAWRLRLLHDADPTTWPISKAIDVCNEAIKINPKTVNLYLFLGELLSMDRDFSGAERIYKKVLRDFNPHNLRAKLGLLEIMFNQDRLDDAEQQIKDIVTAFNPRDPYRYLLVARLEYARGNFYEAMQSLEQLEKEGAQGAVLVLLYHGLSPSEWLPMTSVRRFREHLLALKRAGFKFVSPDRIPALFKAMPEAPSSEIKPWLHRTVRQISYSITGKLDPETPNLHDYTPVKYACVTFDDALRSSFQLGTPVAEELAIPMAMHVPVGNIMKHSIGFASWQEMRKYKQSGNWVLGSHLVNAHFMEPIAEDGTLAYPLPNRTWNTTRNRPETMRAYFARIRNEFRGSRSIMAQELQLDNDEIEFMAYPYGDIGQEDWCNLRDVDNPIKAILNEANMVYKTGFIQSQYGYAINGDNPLLYQRYEPDKQASGQAVLRHAFENHPVFMARRMRAEIAALQGKLYLAQEILAELERDGYPDELLKELTEYVQDHLARKTVQPKITDVNRSRKSQPLVEFSKPYVGIEGSSTRANIQLEQWNVLAKAGLNVTPAITLEGRAAYGHIKQTITTNIWKEITTTKATTTKRQSISTVNGVTTVTEEEETTWEPQTIQTNIVKTDTYKSDETDLAVQANYRFMNGSLLLGEFTGRKFTGNISNETAYCWAGEYQWKPTLALDASVRYERDVIPSARQLITYDSGALLGIWRVRDWWDILGRGRFAYLSDHNSLLNMNGDSGWLVSDKQGVWLGIQAYFITTDKASVYYWTPYWEQRWYLYAKIQRSYPNTYADAQIRIGTMKSKVRDEDEQAYQNLVAQSVAQSNAWYPGEDPNRGWEPIIGGSATVRQKLGRFLEFFGTFGVDVLRDYTEYTLQGGLTLQL